MTPSAHERRLTRRQRTTTTITWSVPRRGRWKSRIVAEEVSVDDVSTTGIGILAPTVPEFQRGARVAIQCHGHDGTIVIRRVSGTNDPTLTRYGVELITPTRELIEVLLAHSDIAARGELEERWNRAN